jgi:hypothetical protein
VPLLFDRSNAQSERNAVRCFEELYDEGRTLGFMPYRIGAQFMPRLASAGAGVAPVIGSLKRALDPHGVLAPGRYSFTRQ